MMEDIASRLAAVPVTLRGDGLPLERHLPGTGSDPDMATLEKVKNLHTHRIGQDNWSENAQYRYGWHLFASEFYWEAHEIWEPVWLHAAVNSRERQLLQCLIQLANARLKRTLGKANASDRLIDHCDSLRRDVFRNNRSDATNSTLGLSNTDLQRLIERTL